MEYSTQGFDRKNIVKVSVCEFSIGKASYSVESRRDVQMYSTVKTSTGFSTEILTSGKR